MYNNIQTKDITDIDLNNAFFHYTNINNLDGISKYGLEARVGKNSEGIEINKKIFFAIGEVGVLIIMDAWIKWLVLRPKSMFIYKCGSYFMKKTYFPKIIVDTIFHNWFKSQRRIKRSNKKLKEILSDSVFLILDLEEGIDFSYDDIDEVKNQDYSRRQLEYIYSYGNDVNDARMENWNMHTFPNKDIQIDKISLLKMHNNLRADDILKYFIENNISYVKNNLPFLFRYYNDIYKV